MANRTELVFILDRSGSMYGLEKDTVGGFNSTLDANRQLDGECSVTTILFNHESKLLHDRLPVQAVKPMTAADYMPSGSTALLDAIGLGMDKIRDVQKSLDKAYRADKVQFIIITDGMENASREYSAERIRRRITEARERFGWDFIFLGANIDAVECAEHMGIRPDRAVTAVSDSEGVQAQYRAVARATVDLRCNMPLDNSWAEEVNMDRTIRGL